MATFACIRVSTETHDLDHERLAIFDYPPFMGQPAT